ncbi:MAG: T9SS type A sorting domain-containing protein [Bacteroidetes bacterium]|nr:T9SS type A sorting domain-containing protein [Bacteroidota bacterium]
MTLRYSILMLGMLMLCTLSVHAQVATAPPGSGTDKAPFEISTIEHLYWVTQNENTWADHFVLTSDINLSASLDWEDGFEPIGNTTTEFTGVFDGQGFSLETYYTFRPDRTGMFGVIGNEGIVRNLNLTNGFVYGNHFVGGIAGVNKGTIERVSYEGLVKGTGETLIRGVGGLVGRNQGNITLSRSMGTVESETRDSMSSGAAGLTMQNDGVITRSFSTADVTGGVSAGFVGTNTGRIENTFSTGVVSGSRTATGFVGSNAEEAVIKNSYSSSPVLASDPEADDVTLTGFIGETDSEDEENIFTDGSWGNPIDEHAVTLTAAQMRDAASFTGFDFTDIWSINQGQSFPYLQSIEPDNLPGDFPQPLAPANLTENTSTFPEFEWLAYLDAVSYSIQVERLPAAASDVIEVDGLTGTSHTLQGALEANREYRWSVRAQTATGASSWSPYQTFTTREFAGGEGTVEDPFLISSITELDNVRNHLSSHFRLLNNIDASFETGDPDGVLWNNGRGLRSISMFFEYFTGTFDGGGYSISGLHMSDAFTTMGLFGYVAPSGVIKRLGLIDVSIRDFNLGGGIVGHNEGLLKESHITGTISGDRGGSRAGGLVGINFGTVQDSYALVDITSEGTTALEAAGLIADNRGTLATSYFAGSLANANEIQPLVFTGEGATETEVTNTFWNTDLVAQTSDFGAGLSSSDMRSSASFTGFDFTNTWTIEEGASFPYLQHVAINPIPGEIVLEVAGRSLSFTNGRAVIPHNNIYEEAEQLAIEFWVYLDELTNRRNGLIEKHVSPGSGWWMHVNNRRLQIFFRMTGTDINYVAPELFNSNTWYHISVNFDGSTVAVYINGELTPPTNANNILGTGERATNTRDIRIGDLNWTSAELKGNIDEVRIWNTVRSEEDIRNTMFQSLNGDEDGLIAYFPFNESEGSVIRDLTTNQNNGTLVTGVIRSDKTHPYGTFIIGTQGWRMMSAPVEASFGNLFQGFWTQGFTGASSEEAGFDSNLLVYNEADRSFVSIDAADDIPAAGTGFIALIYDDQNSDGTPDAFPKVIRTDLPQFNGSIQPNVSFTSNGDPDSEGWNLLGNPYGATIDWDAATGWTRTNIDPVFYVWNNEVGEYQSWNGLAGTLPNEGHIAPWQGFWVRANAVNPVLTMTDEIRSAGGVFARERRVPSISLKVEGEQGSSRAVVMLSEDALTGTDALDAFKLTPLNRNFISLFTRSEDGTPLDINALPSDLTESLEVAIGVNGTLAAGALELSWEVNHLPSDWQFEIRDTQTGELINMREANAIQFEIQSNTSGELSKRSADDANMSGPVLMESGDETEPPLVLVITPGVDTSLENVSNLPAELALRQNFPNPFNPTTTIRYELPMQAEVRLEVFDITGRLVSVLVNGAVQAGVHEVTFDGGRLASGVYLYRLNAGGQVLTQKLTLIK